MSEKISVSSLLEAESRVCGGEVPRLTEGDRARPGVALVAARWAASLEPACTGVRIGSGTTVLFRLRNDLRLTEPERMLPELMRMPLEGPMTLPVVLWPLARPGY